MRFNTLSTKELVIEARGDARYQQDALFTVLVDRLTEWSNQGGPRTPGDRQPNIPENRSHAR